MTSPIDIKITHADLHDIDITLYKGKLPSVRVSISLMSQNNNLVTSFIMDSNSFIHPLEVPPLVYEKIAEIEAILEPLVASRCTDKIHDSMNPFEGDLGWKIS